jgi:hypothetical protein
MEGDYIAGVEVDKLKDIALPTPQEFVLTTPSEATAVAEVGAMKAVTSTTSAFPDNKAVNASSEASNVTEENETHTVESGTVVAQADFGSAPTNVPPKNSRAKVSGFVSGASSVDVANRSKCFRVVSSKFVEGCLEESFGFTSLSLSRSENNEVDSTKVVASNVGESVTVQYESTTVKPESVDSKVDGTVPVTAMEPQSSTNTTLIAKPQRQDVTSQLPAVPADSPKDREEGRVGGGKSTTAATHPVLASVSAVNVAEVAAVKTATQGVKSQQHNHHRTHHGHKHGHKPSSSKMSDGNESSGEGEESEEESEEEAEGK